MAKCGRFLHTQSWKGYFSEICGKITLKGVHFEQSELEFCLPHVTNRKGSTFENSFLTWVPSLTVWYPSDTFPGVYSQVCEFYYGLYFRGVFPGYISGVYFWGSHRTVYVRVTQIGRPEGCRLGPGVGWAWPGPVKATTLRKPEHGRVQYQCH
jgi:hypothetical protein